MELLSLTKSQVLDEFRRALGLSTLRTDCSVEAVDGIELTPLLEQWADAWYSTQLRTADPALLPVSNLSQSVTPAAMHDNMLNVRRDSSRIRVLAVKMADWSRPVVPITLESASQRLERLASPFGTPGCADPLAVLMPDGSVIFGPNCQGGLTDFLCVIDPRPQYVFHPDLLSTITDFVNRQSHPSFL